MTWLQNEAITPPPSGNLYPKGGNPGKKVENSVAVIRESLPKRRKSAEKVENPMIYHLQFTNSNTIYARNRTVYAKGVFVH